MKYYYITLTPQPNNKALSGRTLSPTPKNAKSHDVSEDALDNCVI